MENKANKLDAESDDLERLMEEISALSQEDLIIKIKPGLEKKLNVQRDRTDVGH